MADGERSVMICGAMKRQQLFAGKWATLAKVSVASLHGLHSPVV